MRPCIESARLYEHQHSALTVNLFRSRFECRFSMALPSGREALAVWSPLPPAGYVNVGDVASLSRKDVPPLDACACLRADLAERVDPSTVPVDREGGDGGSGGGYTTGKQSAAGSKVQPVWADTKGWNRVRMAMWGLEARGDVGGDVASTWGVFVGHPGAVPPHSAHRPARGRQVRRGSSDSGGGSLGGTQHGGNGGDVDGRGLGLPPLFNVELHVPRISALLLAGPGAGAGARVPLAALTIADLVATVRGREGGAGARDGFSSFTAALDFFNARLVGRCRLMVSKPEFKALLVSALETKT